MSTIAALFVTWAGVAGVCSSSDETVVAVGRLLDAELRPVVGVASDCTILQRRGSEAEPEIHLSVLADSAGRFEMQLPPPTAASERRVLRFTLDERYSLAGGIESEAIELPEPLPAPRFDLGDVVLCTDSVRASMRWDDERLLREYREGLEGKDAGRVESCMAEMGRRPSPRIQRFLEQEFERVRALSPDFGRPYDTVEDCSLELLTARRRVQRRPDPLAVEVAGEALHFLQGLESLPLDCALRNVDVEGVVFDLQVGGDYRSGRFGRILIEARAADGTLVPPLPPPSEDGGGISRWEDLPAGESLELRFSLEEYVDLVPGEYDLVIRYGNQWSIHGTDLGERILFRSRPQKVVVLPRALSLRRSLARDVARWVDEIDADRAVPLLDRKIPLDVRFLAPATRPEDHLVRLGEPAIPLLIERLRGGGLSPKTTGWILGLLHALTGRDPPRDWAVGKRQSLRAWPGTEGRGESVPSLEDFETRTSFGHDVERDPLIARWIARSACYEITWVED